MDRILSPLKARSARVICSCVIVAIVAIITRAEDPPRQDTGGSTATDLSLGKPQVAKRLREGSQIKNMIGRFRNTGDRYTFKPSEVEGQAKVKEFVVLENLALERIARLVSSSDKREWSVSGAITEFRGGNYLLVERAVLKASPVR